MAVADEVTRQGFDASFSPPRLLTSSATLDRAGSALCDLELIMHG
jgi:hypothetical protein